MQDGIYAKINTEKGDILISLSYKLTPGTVGNFVSLAEGKLENNAIAQGTPYYNGLKFHRVIPDFMVQGGDPQGTGVGGPGYQFDDEFHPDLRTMLLAYCLWQIQALVQTGVSFLSLMWKHLG